MENIKVSNKELAVALIATKRTLAGVLEIIKELEGGVPGSARASEQFGAAIAENDGDVHKAIVALLKYSLNRLMRDDITEQTRESVESILNDPRLAALDPPEVKISKGPSW